MCNYQTNCSFYNPSLQTKYCKICTMLPIKRSNLITKMFHRNILSVVGQSVEEIVPSGTFCKYIRRQLGTPLGNDHPVNIYCEIRGRQHLISWKPDLQAVPMGRNIVTSARCYRLNVPMGRHFLNVNKSSDQSPLRKKRRIYVCTFCCACHFFTGCDAKHMYII